LEQPVNTATPSDLLPFIAAGAQVVVRDEEWIVRSTQQTPSDGLLVRCIGTSTLVRDTEATFVTSLDRVEPLRPEETVLVTDDSPGYRRSRLHLEAIIRKTPVPARETALAVAPRQLLNPLEYQRRATHKALTGLRPRLLIADAVGLGKTLEVGLILSELIRRGRGEKVLVVTPRHILEQFQHELWTRFAIPLVRLDSEGIQRVRRQIPANRNPFTHFKRSIISVDTLKNAGRYRHHLEGIRWDAVVIDECHNLVNKGTLNNQLARVLAPRTEALLLTSATPHNGDPESFAELIRLLDPTAVVDPSKLTADDIAHLYVRRHKGHDEVAPEVADNWADRMEPNPVLVEASPNENALFGELADTWVHPVSGQAPASGKGRSLFPWTLFKAALSSHHALLQTIEARRKTIASSAVDGGLSKDQRAEDDALDTLSQRAAAITDADSAKLRALVDQLRAIGVGPTSATRVVVFSERIATLDWLKSTAPPILDLKPNQVRVLHGGMADVKQMDVIEEFGLADAPVRLLFTGDMASEGVNLHRECHHLIHFDLPWSLITIEQRNGRIDRYGQTHPPDIRALVLTPDHVDCTGDVRILTRLLEREHAAHKAFGESGSLLGLHAPELEEKAVMQKLRDREDPDTAIPAEPAKQFDLLALLSGATGTTEVPTYTVPTLFESDKAFVDEALRFAFHDADRELDIRREVSDPDYLSLVPPRDLVSRFQALPHSYLSEQHIVDRIRLTGDSNHAEAALTAARASTESQWPNVGFLSPLHPEVDWLVDKVLAKVGRNEAPVLFADVDRPTFAVLGSFSNGRGQPQLVEWMAVSVGPDGTLVSDLFATLARAGVTRDMVNPGRSLGLDDLARHLPAAVHAARDELERRRGAHDRALADLLETPRRRLDAWQRRTNQLALLLDDRRRIERDRRTRSVVDDTTALIESMRTVGQPLVRVLTVLVGAA
jgi:superfamily II DNA or RNA helicase